jgi:CubicO group peptidase (beta-lactamase class C family)
MRLVEEGKIDLDAPVDNYLTRWQSPPSSHIHDEVTVRGLLSHTAGLAPWNYPGVPVDTVYPSLVDLLSAAASGKGVEVTRQPGLKATYTNGGYLILQLLVEDITGETFPEYMQRQVL